MRPTMRVSFRIILMLWAGVAAVCVSAQPDQKQVAALRNAPPLKLDKLLQAPAGTSTDWTKLKGKLVVIDFWATWCSPCVEAIPHFNQMAKELADQPIVFIAVTDDDETRLNEFLKGTPIKTWIGLDSARVNWTAFDLHSIPTTVIVSPEGKWLANTRPDNLTTQKLRDLLRGQVVALPPPETRDSNLAWDQEEIEWKDGVSPIAEVIIKRIKTATSGSWMKPGGNFLTADGVPLSVLVQMAYQTDSDHMDWRIPRSANPESYRVVARVPKGREQQLLPLFQNTLAATFGLKTGWHSQERDVFVLRVIDGQTPKLTVSAKDEERDLRALRGKGVSRRNPISWLSEFLSHFVLDAIVIDETNLKGEYNWELPYQHGKPELTLPLLEKMGLEVIKAKRIVNVLVVELEQ